MREEGKEEVGVNWKRGNSEIHVIISWRKDKKFWMKRIRERGGGGEGGRERGGEGWVGHFFQRYE